MFVHNILWARKGNIFSMEINIKKQIEGRCPSVLPAPVFDKWGPNPIYLSWAKKTSYIEIGMKGTSSPSNSPYLKNFVLIRTIKVTFLFWRKGDISKLC